MGTAVVSGDDPRLADYRHLVDARFRARYERAAGVFVAEGHLAVARLLESPYPVRSVAVATPRLERFGSLAAAAAARGADVLVAEPEVLAEVCGFDPHRGVLAIGERRPGPSVASLLDGGGLVVAAEGLNDGENLGALGRAAAAFGAAGLLLDPSCADPLTRRAVRVSLGHILAVPLARAEPWPEALDRPGVEVVALTPEPTAEPLPRFAARLGDTGRPAGALVLVVGAEGPGLSGALLTAADHRVRIPIAPGVDSLNVAAAAAVVLSHLQTEF